MVRARWVAVVAVVVAVVVVVVSVLGFCVAAVVVIAGEVCVSSEMS